MKYDYDVIVLGGGAAGLVAATGTAGLGARTAMIDKTKLGGDCTWYGCIPSKTLLKAASVFSYVNRIEEFGISKKGEANYDTSRVMSHVRDVINEVSTHHPPEVFEKRGIKVLFGNVRFMDDRTVDLNGKKITAKRFIISTGSHPMTPLIEGLEGIDYLTNENIFDLEVLPKSTIVLGAGPIGVEISQALSRLGVEISIVEMFDRILFREDEEAVNIVSDALTKTGIKIYTSKKAIKFSKDTNAVNVILEDKDKKHYEIKAEKVLIAAGRAPNVEGLDLEAAGVKYNKKGIEVNDYLQTTAKNIYACGDVASPYQFSHMAEYQAVIVVQNALFPFKSKGDYSTVPWATFTEPELARVGLTEAEARQKYSDIKVYKSNYSENDRAVTDLEKRGFSKVITDKKGNILGAHIVGANAGEIIHEYVLCKSAKLNIRKLSSAIHIYPTLAQTVKRTGDQYVTEIFKAGWFKALTKFMLKFLK